jgi:hypothetical protein
VRTEQKNVEMTLGTPEVARRRPGAQGN